MSRFKVQVQVAMAKAKHPELYCPIKQCLWRTGGGLCPRHQPIKPPSRAHQAIKEA